MSRNLSPQQFGLIYRPIGEDHEVVALHPDTGDYLGGLEWDGNNGVVSGIYVPHTHRRRGIATSLWNEAHRVSKERGFIAPVHASDLSNDGRAWVSSLGVHTGSPASERQL